MKDRKNDTKELTRKAREICRRTIEDIFEEVDYNNKNTEDFNAEVEYVLAEVVKNLTQELSTWVWEDLENGE